MKIIRPSAVIESDVAGAEILKRLERYGRTAYKSEDRITPESARSFVAGIIKSGHESVIEHETVTVRVVCDRGVSHEIVRHRIGASYTQESTRYCNYHDQHGSDVSFIRPFFFETGSRQDHIWGVAMTACETAYNQLIEAGASPQEARSVLPNSLKTEIVITYNLRSWRHFFSLRCSARAHPQMREITVPMLKEFKRLIPGVFDDIYPEQEAQA